MFTYKYTSCRSIEKYKTRLVAQGFTQIYGIVNKETFALIAKLNSIKILLFIAVNLDWNLIQLDIKNVFLHRILEEDIYMPITPGFEEEFRAGKVCTLKKSLYALKQLLRD